MRNIRSVTSISLGLLIGGALVPAVALADTATNTFNVTATVLKVCTVSAGNLAFGNYDPTAATPTTGTSTVSMLCTLNTPYNVRLSQGANGTGVTDRKMIGGGGSDTLAYSLYRDASYTQNWGITDTTDTVDGTATGVLQTHTVYGRIAAQTTAPVGSYSDTVTVTVNY